ncbi:TGS domain-containing protein, partial [Candidatus Micrarchaeota archaeon]|nr:TGS domain-containing protein [Candidatus Micrarchaeota archaeon]
VDLLKENSLKKVDYPFLPVSAMAGFNIDQLKEAIYQKLDLIRVYTKSKWEEADLTEPLMIKKGSAITDVCEQLHRDLVSEFKFAQVWGKSAKHPGQKLGLKHVLSDGDLVYIHKK